MKAPNSNITGIGLRRLSLDMALTFGRQFFAGLLQLGIILFISRLLGPEGAGAYAVALLLPTLLSQLLNLGMAPANVYFVASKQFNLTHAWTACRNLVLGLSVVGLTIGGGSSFWRAQPCSPELTQSYCFWRC